MSTEGSVNYTVKELLAMLEKTLSQQIEQIGVRIEEVNRKLDLRASTASVEALERRVSDVERKLAGSAAVSLYQRWIFGTVGIGVLGAIATLVWLASGGH